MAGETSADRNVFISFSSGDKEKAVLVCDGLERAGLRCWISLRDVGAGHNYQAEIVNAIQTAKAMVLVFSARTNASAEVSKELSLASAFKRLVIPFRIEDVVPQGAFLYELATRQWIDAFAGWDAALGNLVAAVRQAAGEGAVGPAPAASPPPPSAPVHARISERALEAARAALTPHLGPIARVLVRKVSGEAASVEDLYERLAAHLPTAEEKAAFRNRVRSGSSG
jgi:TIR domain